MNIKSFTVLFLTAIIMFSFAVLVLPSANALTARTDFYNRHGSASFGYSNICGDHICKPGERSAHTMKINDAQRGGKQDLQQLRSYAEKTQLGYTHKMSENMNMTGSAGMPSKSIK
jgi:hypothetical protein